MKTSQLILLLVGLVLGIFIGNTGIFNGCKKADPCADLIDSVTKIDTVYSIDTLSVVHDTIIVEVEIPVKSSGSFSDETDLNLDQPVYSYEKTVWSVADDGGILKGKIRINTFGQTLKSYTLDWEYDNTLLFKFKRLNKETTINHRQTITQETAHTLDNRKNTLLVGSSIGFQSKQIKDVNLNLSFQFKSKKMLYYELSQPLVDNSNIIHRIGAKIPIL